MEVIVTKVEQQCTASLSNIFNNILFIRFVVAM